MIDLQQNIGKLSSPVLKKHRHIWKTAVAMLLDEISMVAPDQLLQANECLKQEDEMSHYKRDYGAIGVSCNSIPLTTLDSGRSYVQSCAGLTKEAEELPWSYKENNWCASDFNDMLVCKGYGDVNFCGSLLLQNKADPFLQSRT